MLLLLLLLSFIYLYFCFSFLSTLFHSIHNILLEWIEGRSLGTYRPARHGKEAWRTRNIYIYCITGASIVIVSLKRCSTLWCNAAGRQWHIHTVQQAVAAVSTTTGGCWPLSRKLLSLPYVCCIVVPMHMHTASPSVRQSAAWHWITKHVRCVCVCVQCNSGAMLQSISAISHYTSIIVRL